MITVINVILILMSIPALIIVTVEGWDILKHRPETTNVRKELESARQVFKEYKIKQKEGKNND